MKILGIVGSCRKDGVSGVHRLVTTVLQNTDFVWRLFGKSAHLHYKFAYRNRVKDLVDEVSVKILKEA